MDVNGKERVLINAVSKNASVSYDVELDKMVVMGINTSDEKIIASYRNFKKPANGFAH